MALKIDVTAPRCREGHYYVREIYGKKYIVFRDNSKCYTNTPAQQRVRQAFAQAQKALKNEDWKRYFQQIAIEQNVTLQKAAISFYL